MVNDGQNEAQRLDNKTPSEFRPSDPLHEQALQLAYKQNPDLHKYVQATDDARAGNAYMEAAAVASAATAVLGMTQFGRPLVSALRYGTAAVFALGAYNYIDGVHRQDELANGLRRDERHQDLLEVAQHSTDDHLKFGTVGILTIANMIGAGRAQPMMAVGIAALAGSHAYLDAINQQRRAERIKDALDCMSANDLERSGKPTTYERVSRDIMFPSEAFDRLNPPREPVRPPVQPFRPPVLRSEPGDYDMYVRK